MLFVSLVLVSYKTVPTTNHEGELKGRFSVSKTDKVCFSKGNLQYCPATKQWRFAEHQWEYIGKKNEFKGTESEFENYRGWIDMFGFCTSGWYDGHYNINYKPSPFKKEYEEPDYNYKGYGPHKKSPNRSDPRYDWGMYNRIINGGNMTNSWRCLNEEEWYYLLWKRECNHTTGFYKNREAEFKSYNEKHPEFIAYSYNYYIGLATVVVNDKKIYGLVILPDDWDGTPSQGYTFKSYAHAKRYKIEVTKGGPAVMSYSDNIYTYPEWCEMERYGAVLLPASGDMFPTTDRDPFYDNVGGKVLCYWEMMSFNWNNRKSTEEYFPDWYDIPYLCVAFNGLLEMQSFSNGNSSNNAVRLVRDIY